jgi:hypothetical protein
VCGKDTLPYCPLSFIQRGLPAAFRLSHATPCTGSAYTQSCAYVPALDTHPLTEHLSRLVPFTKQHPYPNLPCRELVGTIEEGLNNAPPPC